MNQDQRRTPRTVRRPASRTRRPLRRRPPVFGLSRAGLVLALGLLILLGTCSAPPLRLPFFSQAPMSVPLGAHALDHPTPLARLPTVTPWPSPSATAGPALPPPADPLPQPTAPSLLPPAVTAIPLDEVGVVIDTYIQDLTNSGYFSGAILVAHDGQILLNKGYGMANAERNLPNTPQTRFRLASLSKSFTAMAILQLQGRNRLNINDPICTYIPDCSPAWQPVTIRHLLNHTSGIPNYTDFADFDQTEMLPTTIELLIERFKYEPLLFEPGTLYSYSNSGYVLLGKIIEQASGVSYADFVQANMFKPLEMWNSGYDFNIEYVTDRAAGYAVVWQPADPIDPSTLYAAGALYSTAEDLYRWDQALYTDQLLPRARVNEMFTPNLGEYGYGWRISGHNGHRVVNHTGLINGFSNYFARYPDERLTVIVLSNLQITDAYGIGMYLAQLVLESQK